MKYIKQLILLFLSLLLFSTGVRAEGKRELMIQAGVDKAFITIGDRVTYSLAVYYPESVTVSLDNIAPDMDAFEVRDISTTTETLRGTTNTMIMKQWVLTTFTVGNYVIRGPEVTFKRSDGTSDSIIANNIYIHVETSADSMTNELSEVKGIAEVKKMHETNTAWWILGCALGGAALSGIAFFVRRRWQNTGAQANAAIDPLFEAESTLKNIFDKQLVEKGLIKECFTQLSDCIKSVLGVVYHIDTRDRTTRELQIILHTVQIAEAITSEIIAELELCDTVKFANYKPTHQEIHAAFTHAKNIIAHCRQMQDSART